VGGITGKGLPENLDVDKVLYSIDFAEKLTNSIIEHRLGTGRNS